MSDTPKTDAKQKLKDMIGDEYVSVEFSRKLERERDGYQEQADALVDRLGATQERMIDAERERDEAREQLSIALAEINRLDVTGIHSCHSECEKTSCVLRRELAAITEQRDNCQLEIQIVIERLKGNRHPDDNGMKYQGEIDVKSIIAQRDRLAAVLQRIRDGYGGQVASPNCCEDCDYLLPIDDPRIPKQLSPDPR